MSSDPKITVPHVRLRQNSSGRRRISVKRRYSPDSTGLSGPNPGPSVQTKKKRVSASARFPRHDNYCWMCHKEAAVIFCSLCCRGYHRKCLAMFTLPKVWICPECQSEAFQREVDLSEFPNYHEIVVYPMDLSKMRKSIVAKEYGSTHEFLSDAKWILHNCVVFNGNEPRVSEHDSLVKIALVVLQMSDIDTCYQCYHNMCTKYDWFIQPCRPPHTLVWAKLKGHPFWPAKAVKECNGQVDIRFFGAHDRAWVPVSQVCLLSSRDPPTRIPRNKKAKKMELDASVAELRSHIDLIRESDGNFNFAPCRTPFDLRHLDAGSKFTGIDVTSSGCHGTRRSQRRVTRSRDRGVDGGSSVLKTALALKSKYNTLSHNSKSAPGKRGKRGRRKRTLGSVVPHCSAINGSVGPADRGRPRLAGGKATAFGYPHLQRAPLCRSVADVSREDCRRGKCKTERGQVIPYVRLTARDAVVSRRERHDDHGCGAHVGGNEDDVNTLAGERVVVNGRPSTVIRSSDGKEGGRGEIVGVVVPDTIHTYTHLSSCCAESKSSNATFASCCRQVPRLMSHGTGHSIILSSDALLNVSVSRTKAGIDCRASLGWLPPTFLPASAAVRKPLLVGPLDASQLRFSAQQIVRLHLASTSHQPGVIVTAETRPSHHGQQVAAAMTCISRTPILVVKTTTVVGRTGKVRLTGPGRHPTISSASLLRAPSIHSLKLTGGDLRMGLAMKTEKPSLGLVGPHAASPTAGQQGLLVPRFASSSAMLGTSTVGSVFSPVPGSRLSCGAMSHTVVVRPSHPSKMGLNTIGQQGALVVMPDSLKVPGARFVQSGKAKAVVHLGSAGVSLARSALAVPARLNAPKVRLLLPLKLQSKDFPHQEYFLEASAVKLACSSTDGNEMSCHNPVIITAVSAGCLPLPVLASRQSEKNNLALPQTLMNVPIMKSLRCDPARTPIRSGSGACLQRLGDEACWRVDGCLPTDVLSRRPPTVTAEQASCRGSVADNVDFDLVEGSDGVKGHVDEVSLISTACEATSFDDVASGSSLEEGEKSPLHISNLGFSFTETTGFDVRHFGDVQVSFMSQFPVSAENRSFAADTESGQLSTFGSKNSCSGGDIACPRNCSPKLSDFSRPYLDLICSSSCGHDRSTLSERLSTSFPEFANGFLAELTCASNCCPEVSCVSCVSYRSSQCCTVSVIDGNKFPVASCSSNHLLPGGSPIPGPAQSSNDASMRALSETLCVNETTDGKYTSKHPIVRDADSLTGQDAQGQMVVDSCPVTLACARGVCVSRSALTEHRGSYFPAVVTAVDEISGVRGGRSSASAEMVRHSTPDTVAFGTTQSAVISVPSTHATGTPISLPPHTVPVGFASRSNRLEGNGLGHVPSPSLSRLKIHSAVEVREMESSAGCEQDGHEPLVRSALDGNVSLGCAADGNFDGVELVRPGETDLSFILTEAVGALQSLSVPVDGGQDECCQQYEQPDEHFTDASLNLPAVGSGDVTRKYVHGLCPRPPTHLSSSSRFSTLPSFAVRTQMTTSEMSGGQTYDRSAISQLPFVLSDIRSLSGLEYDCLDCGPSEIGLPMIAQQMSCGHPPCTPLSHSQSGELSSAHRKDRTPVKRISSVNRRSQQEESSGGLHSTNRFVHNSVNSFMEKFTNAMQSRVSELSTELSNQIAANVERQFEECVGKLKETHRLEISEIRHSHMLQLAELRAGWREETREALLRQKHRLQGGGDGDVQDEASGE